MTYTKFDRMVEFSPKKIIQDYWKNKSNSPFQDVENEYKEFLLGEKYKENMQLDNFFTFFIGENPAKKGFGSPNSLQLKMINLKKI